MYFFSENTITKKISVSLLVIAVFGMGLLFLKGRSEILVNFKTYYIRAYIYGASYFAKESMARPLSALFTSNVSDAAEKDAFAQSVPILLYHGLLDNNPGSEASNVDLTTFWDQIRTLKDAGWQTVTMKDFLAFKRGEKQLPKKSFLLTFDDGRKDSFYPAVPLLKALNYHAVMFVIDKYSSDESKYYLSLRELEMLSNSSNWEIQSHGYSSHTEYPINAWQGMGHFFSNKLWLSDLARLETEEEFVLRVTKDLQIAKSRLEDNFNKHIFAFAFPFGDYGINYVNFPEAESHVVPAALKVYPLVFYQYSNIYRYTQDYQTSGERDGSFMVRRIGISPEWSGKELLNLFESGEAKSLPFSAKLDKTDGWINTDWGTMTLKRNTMTIASIPTGTGSTVILDGSRNWTDYSIKAEVRWVKGSNIYLSARYADDENLAACNFSRSLAHIEQVLKGNKRVIAGVNHQFEPGDSPFIFGMKVKGRTVECSINGRVIVSTPFLDSSLSVGGITLKSWDNQPHNSEMQVLSLKVESE